MAPADSQCRRDDAPCALIRRQGCSIEQGGVEENDLRGDDGEADFVITTACEGIAPARSVPASVPSQVCGTAPLPNVLRSCLSHSAEGAGAKVGWSRVDPQGVVPVDELGLISQGGRDKALRKEGPGAFCHSRLYACAAPCQAILSVSNLARGRRPPDELHGTSATTVAPMRDPLRVVPPSCAARKCVAQEAQEACRISDVAGCG